MDWAKHRRRDLQGIIDSSDSIWAKEMKVFLKKTKLMVDDAKITNAVKLPENLLLELKIEYQNIIDKGEAETPPPPRTKTRKARPHSKG
jgi:hypothetical protein